MKFGIWFEPEMISPDSELYKAHPDWAIQIKGRPLTLCREQYVLDYSRKEVRDHVYGMMKKILDSANIEYIKWDMNRQLTVFMTLWTDLQQIILISCWRTAQAVEQDLTPVCFTTAHRSGALTIQTLSKD